MTAAIKKRFNELPVEEVSNAITHGFGLVLSVAGFVFLVWLPSLVRGRVEDCEGNPVARARVQIVLASRPAIDFAIGTPGAAGWWNGDFNYDGLISADDYAAIDFNVVAQGTPL